MVVEVLKSKTAETSLIN